MASKGEFERKCGKIGCSNVGDKKCSRCKNQFYCSKECQKADWKTHKKTCKKEEHGTKSKPKENHGDRNLSYSFQNILDFAVRRLAGQSHSVANEYMKAFPKDKPHGRLIEEFEMLYCMQVAGEKTNLKQLNNEDFTKPENIMKRWRGVLLDGDLLWNFLKGPRTYGDIYVRARHPPYSNQTFQTMRNTSTADQVYEFGRTYVSFGFVDLFQLVWGQYLHNTTEALTFYGWDMNRVTVLRSKLIYIIFKYFTESEISTISALQIWFSTCWDSETSSAFNHLIENLLGDTQKYGLCNEDVTLLELWQRGNISAKEAKSKFNEKPRNGQFDGIWRMKTVKDRVKFLRYIFTGCIFAEEDITVCGNPTMFTSYKGQTKQSEESFFKAIDLHAQGMQYVDVSDRSDSLFDTVTSATIRAVHKFRDLVHEDRIVCHLQVKFIDTKDGKFAGEINALNPYSIDWSNTLDYMEKKSFIRFARACSVEDTVHYAHFLNWDQYVFGACHVDWCNNQEKCNEMYNEFLSTKKLVDDAFGRAGGGFTEFFTGPTYTNPLNGVNLMLTIKFRHIFEDFFLSYENGKVLNRFKADVHHGLVSPFFSQSPTMFRSVFTFNDQIKLQTQYT